VPIAVGTQLTLFEEAAALSAEVRKRSAPIWTVGICSP